MEHVMADKNRTTNAGRDTNPDPITGAPGSHPVATGVGAAAAGAAGAAIGSIVPGVGTVVGGVVGAIAGSVGGGYAGKAVGEMIDPTGTDEYWKENYKTREYAKGSNYDELRPAYRYGATLAEQSKTPDFDESRARREWASNKEAAGLPFERARGAIQDEFNRTLQLREEKLNVNKERVSAGEVELKKEVTTERKTIEVPVEREEVVITRRDVSGNRADGGAITGEEEIRVPVSEERVNVSKDTVVTGEVGVEKRTVTDMKTVSDDLRKEDVKVENTGNARVQDRTKDA
jgi:uncharacterized protein (TIGR02271 family)